MGQPEATVDERLLLCELRAQANAEVEPRFSGSPLHAGGARR